jgi:hypothetical protein
MKKQKRSFNYIVLAVTLISVAAIFIAAKKPPYPPKLNPLALVTPSVMSPKTASLYYSDAEKTNFCDGDNMDSAGYAKTIDKDVSLPLAEWIKTNESEFSYLLQAGSDYVGESYSCPDSFVKDLQFKFRNNVAYVFNPGGGWAGISIAMCTCEPFLDYNLSRTFGMTKTTWVSTQADWDAIK